MAKIIVDKWFYIYSIPGCIHRDKGHCFENEIMEHLYAMYGIQQIIQYAWQLTMQAAQPYASLLVEDLEQRTKS